MFISLLQYEKKPNVNVLVEFLIALLDTPKKLEIVNDIRYMTVHSCIH